MARTKIVRAFFLRSKQPSSQAMPRNPVLRATGREKGSEANSEFAAKFARSWGELNRFNGHI